MIKLDIDTIHLYKGEVNEENCICFYGDKDFTWNILYKQNLSSVKSFDFYKIINPTDSKLIYNLYIFNYLTDALTFYKTRGESFFKNGLIVIVDHQSKKEVAQILTDQLNSFKPKAPKLHFYHREEKADLYLFYLELLKIDVSHEISYLSNELTLSIEYKSSTLKLSFRELKRLRFFLGFNDKTFKIKNNILSLIDTKQIIIW